MSITDAKSKPTELDENRFSNLFVFSREEIVCW